jgi:hypothetical protein
MDNYQMKQQAKVVKEASQSQPETGRGDRFFYGYILVAASFLLQAIGWGLTTALAFFSIP